ncbi:Kelch repeat-containing protein [Turneriella parva]|uniref:Kelch repeat type 1-containing protein n=1 Tax=Turneriella parva (strain ATCC BAA-1111 / DSM 21527 / NCTC 11395 / H) TaxID=869212 RepID=I4B232_TURPD|nr:kelch repeat-containing protein [Turneriella parva]AFM11339.1 Kelch repeat type 1-containing protein [Turneriella parva DSM 21527]
MKYNRLGLFALLLSTYCSRPVAEKIDIDKARIGLRLADGSTISTDEYDEYNPVLIQRPDSKLALIFASDRDCASCSAGMHNLFIAVSATAYNNDLQMPVFESPVVVRPNGSAPLNSAQRIRYSALPFSTDIAFAYEIGAGTYSFELTPATQLTGIGSGLGGIGNSTRSADTFLGFGPEIPSMISRDGTMTVRYSKVDSAHNGGTLNNFLLNFAENVSRVPSSVTGYNTSMIFADPSGIWFSTLDFPVAPSLSVNISLLSEGLFLSNANVSVTNAATNDFLLFSADDFISDDLYVVTSHSIGDLWLQDTFMPPGDLSDSKAFRNNWRILSATLPASLGQMAAAVVGDKAYLIGGTADGSTATNTIYEFDFLTETFTNCGSNCGTWPTNIMNAAGIEYNGRVYVFGGGTAAGAANGVANVRYFDPTGPSVTSATSHSLARANMSVTAVGSRIYAMGGISTTTDCNAGTAFGCTNNHYFEPDLDSWSAAQVAVSHNFSSGATAGFGDTIFAFGGFINSGSTLTDAVSQYDANGNTWTNCGSTCPVLATPRYGLAAVSIGNSAYVIGGQNASATQYTLVEEYNFLTNMKTDCSGGCTALPSPRSLGGVVTRNGKIYYFGGLSGSAGTTTIYEYTP